MALDSNEKAATLFRMVMPDHVCPYGLKSKDLLEREGFTVDDRHLTTREETDAFAEAPPRSRRLRTVTTVLTITIAPAAAAAM